MLTVQDVMTSKVNTVARETPLRDVASLLINNGISGVPVVDAAGEVLGIVSEADFLVKEQGAKAFPHRRSASRLGETAEARAQMEKLAARTAGEAMTSPAVTIGPSRPIHEAAEIMTGSGINRLPFVKDGCLVGIVTRT